MNQEWRFAVGRVEIPGMCIFGDITDVPQGLVERQILLWRCNMEARCVNAHIIHSRRGMKVMGGYVTRGHQCLGLVWDYLPYTPACTEAILPADKLVHHVFWMKQGKWLGSNATTWLDCITRLLGYCKQRLSPQAQSLSIRRHMTGEVSPIRVYGDMN